MFACGKPPDMHACALQGDGEVPQGVLLSCVRLAQRLASSGWQPFTCRVTDAGRAWLRAAARHQERGQGADVRGGRARRARLPRPGPEPAQVRRGCRVAVHAASNGARMREPLVSEGDGRALHVFCRE